MTPLQALAHAPAPRAFTAGFDVLGDLRQRHEAVAFPVIAFDQDVWDFGNVPGVRSGLLPSQLRVQWNLIANPVWQLACKEIAAAMLNPEHPCVAALPERRNTPLPLGSLFPRSCQWRAWLAFLDDAGISNLAEVRDEHFNRYLSEGRRRLKPSSLEGSIIGPVRDFSDYGPVLNQTYPPTVRPWGWTTAYQLSGQKRRKTNSSPWIPDEVFEPLVAGALFHVDVAADDIIAARDEVRRVKATPKIQATAEVDRRLREALRRHTDTGEPLPGLPARNRRSVERTTALDNINFQMLCAHVGCSAKRTSLTPELTALIGQAAEEVGIAPGDLWTPISSVRRADGLLGPWRNRFARFEVSWEAARLQCACFIVVAALSGMRLSEILELVPGAVERLEAPHGGVRWRVHSKLMKGRPHGGAPETWTVIKPVVNAIEVMQRLHGPEWDGTLFAARAHAIDPHLLDGANADLQKLYVRLFDWQNKHGAQAGLPPIPDYEGSRWKLDSQHFRRTLARQMSFRPHGILAAKIHLKHVHTAVTEGYFGPAGESAQSFHHELEEYGKEARRERFADLYQRWNQGERIAGNGGRKLVQSFEAIHRELEAFQGTVEQNQRRLTQLLRRDGASLYISVLNDCHFTDSSVARCLRKRAADDRARPIVPACDPTCGNAVRTKDHIPVLQGPVLHITNLLGDRRLPENERIRLQNQKNRITNMIKEIVDEPT
jgi:hypothetical protein